LAVEALFVLFVEEDDIVAGVFLKLFVDDHPIDEESCIAEFFAVGSVDNVNEGMEARDLVCDFLF
jgi:hypothetical protein